MSRSLFLGPSARGQKLAFLKKPPHESVLSYRAASDPFCSNNLIWQKTSVFGPATGLKSTLVLICEDYFCFVFYNKNSFLVYKNTGS